MTTFRNEYDFWLTTDVVGEKEWEEIYYREWVESLVRIENPNADESYIQHLTDERVLNRWYDFDF